MDDTVNGFTEREKAFEAKYLHDEEIDFRIHAKCNHLFGLWAANLLGYTHEKAHRYIEDMIIGDIQKIHSEDVLHKVLKDLKRAHVRISEHQVRKEFQKCFKKAQEIVMHDHED